MPPGHPLDPAGGGTLFNPRLLNARVPRDPKDCSMCPRRWPRAKLWCCGADPADKQDVPRTRSGTGVRVSVCVLETVPRCATQDTASYDVASNI